MKCVIDKYTKELVYAFDDQERVIIDASGMTTASFIAADIKPDTHEILSLPDAPSTFGREWKWDGVAWIAGSARKQRILDRLSAIDVASIRPARAVAVGLASASDLERLETLENEANALRAELQAI